jgi:hypothetical protein
MENIPYFNYRLTFLHYLFYRQSNQKQPTTDNIARPLVANSCNHKY